ncbi:MAG TPA: kynureninase [Candidatus Polarisedimenticolia bacterium]|nr:kynureninase [Candidatus Polarisedimenticolia bacterium]
MTAEAFRPDEAFARELDAADPLGRFRDGFEIPAGADGKPAAYLCGHSLGLMPKGARPLVDSEMEDWARLGVAGHFAAGNPWYSYHERFRESGARLVGGRPGDVVMMNSLTVNLHLMMATFYRPAGGRHAILIEAGAFPSDRYAVASQVRHHGFDPEASLILARPRPEESVLRTEDLERLIEERGAEIALVLLPGVQYRTGEVLDTGRLSAAARRQGCRVGLDLAHAVGNVPLRLDEWGVDFAVWCSYKYLNAGPGAVGGCFVHARHGAEPTLPRLAGWWGNDPETRFAMPDEFVPRAGADGWQVSNPPILSMAPLLASLTLFEEAGLESLRARSVRLTGYLLSLIDHVGAARFDVLTPREPARRGCQVSLRVRRGARDLVEALAASGVVCDFREPDVLRVSAAPLYNRFHDVWRFAQVLGRHAA